MDITIKSLITDCSTQESGEKIKNMILLGFNNKELVVISFDKIIAVSTSFINTAFIDLLNEYSYEYLKANLKIIKANNSIRNLITRRFRKELNMDLPL